MQYFNNLMQISLAKKIFIKANDINTDVYNITNEHGNVIPNGTAEFFQLNDAIMIAFAPEKVNNKYLPVNFDMNLFFEDQRRSFIGNVDYNNVYKNTIEGNLFIGHIFDERIFRQEFKESVFNFSIAMRKINKTIYPYSNGVRYKLNSLV